VDVTHDATADEDVLDGALPFTRPLMRGKLNLSREDRGKRYQMGVLDVVDDRDVIQLDVEVLVHALERAADLDIVLELDRHDRVDERLEKAVRVWLR